MLLDVGSTPTASTNSNCLREKSPGLFVCNEITSFQGINVVAWNGGKPKIDVRDWDENHERMSRGITLTEDQAMKMTKALVDRYRTRANQEHSTPMRDDYAR